jgi:hypothetical protein
MERIHRLALPLALTVAASACDQGVTAPLPLPEVAAGVTTSPGLTVMSRNVYVGADIGVLLGGGDPTTLLTQALLQIQHTDFGTRARALAMEILQEQPHLVGLQEVTTLGLPDALAAQLNLPPQISYLDILMAWIGGLGGNYVVASYHPNFQLQLPAFGGVISYTDGEAILARGDVGMSDAGGGTYASYQTAQIAGFPVQRLRGWADVLATGAGQTVRFVSSHLEVQSFGDVQEEQARELVGTFADETHPVILVGDFNSAADRLADAPETSGSYHVFRNGGYTDVWLREGTGVDGQTCCHTPLLDNTEPMLYSRLDLVLARYGPAGFGGRVAAHLVGDEAGDIVPAPGGYTLWPSDHAGIVATLWPARGIRMKTGG